MANAHKCTPELVDEAEKLKKNGMSNADIVSCLRIGRSTFYRWLSNPRTSEEKELVDRLKGAEAEFKAALRSRIIAKSRDNWQAAAWMLERMFPDEYARPEVQLARRDAVSSETSDDELSKSLEELGESL